MMRKTLFVFLAVALAGCASTTRRPEPATANLALAALDAQSASSSIRGTDYRIGALDLLSVNVFQVPDLSFEQLRVDASGLIEMPLIGTIPAAGRTPSELADDIRTRLANNYLQNPQVTVRVAEATSQKVTVDGAVTEPGVYEMKGRTTLLQAVAMAKGASRVADLRSVAVFRNMNNTRTVAVFDLAAIRNGEATDPVLQGDDIVVVDSSRLNVIMREVTTVLPALGIFRPY